MLVLRLSLAALTMVIAAPALADATTYTGTIGKIPVVVELSTGIEEATEVLAGRYFYPTMGIDIPLDAMTVQPGQVELTEEIPCTPALCEQPFMDETFPEAVRGAKWSLRSSDNGETITGTWQNGEAKPLPIRLAFAGTRMLDDAFAGTPDGMVLTTYSSRSGKQPFTLETAPYDYLRTATRLAFEPDTRWGDLAFTYGVDPRTKFRFPRITDLGGVDFTRANQRLANIQASMSIDALACAAQTYFGMGWTPSMEYAADTLGGFPDESVNVTYLSPTIMSWTEGGSTSCGGAYPDNHFNYTNLDIRTGRDLDMGRIFADWGPHDWSTGEAIDPAVAAADPSAYHYAPGQTLIDFARSKRVKGDADYEESCAPDDLIAEYLAISFREGDRVIFTLQDLPHVVVACGEDIYEAPIAELRQFLAPTAAEYFPSLAP